MTEYIIGLDLGTSQTKICTRKTNNQPNTAHAFILHKFSSTGNYLLPSTISIDKSGRVKYGSLDDDALINFKMKALFPKVALYKILNEYTVPIDGGFSNKQLESLPELSVVLYLAYCILDVKDSFKVVLKTNNQNSDTKGPLGRFVTGGAREVKEFNYRITLGIPTKLDYNAEEHERRNKQYEMLFIANELAKEFADARTYTSCVLSDLIYKINNLIDKYFKEERTVPFYRSKDLYVVAEATAGVYLTLNQIVKARGRLENRSIDSFKKSNYGNYISFDVGAGTTDVSFFRIYEESDAYGRVNVIMRYYAAESITIASNDLYKYYSNKIPHAKNTIDLINYVNDKDKDWIEAQIHIKGKIYDSIRAEGVGLVSKVRTAFIGRFRASWDINESNGSAKGIKVYGGGSAFSAFSSGDLVLCYGGLDLYMQHLCTNSLCSPLFRNNEIFGNLIVTKPDLSRLRSHEIHVYLYPILNLCIGLTMVDDGNRPDGLGQMNVNQPILTRIEIVNEGNEVDGNEAMDMQMKRFDFFNRDWI